MTDLMKGIQKYNEKQVEAGRKIKSIIKKGLKAGTIIGGGDHGFMMKNEVKAEIAAIKSSVEKFNPFKK